MRKQEFIFEEQVLHARKITSDPELIEAAKTLQHELQNLTGKWEERISFRTLCRGFWYAHKYNLRESMQQVVTAGKQYIDIFNRLDEFNNIQIRVGIKVAILNLSLAQDYIELWGFTVPQTITKIVRDPDSSHIVKFEFNNDPENIWPRHDIVSYNGNVFDHSAFFKTRASAEHALTTMTLSVPEGFDFRNHINESVNESVVTEYETRTANSKEIFAQLKAAGYQYIGGGVDATVWGKDEGEVLKVLMPSGDKEEAERSFMIFHDACVAMQNNPHVPRFVDQQSVFEINGTDYTQITMERLHPIVENSLEEAMVWGLSELATVAFIKWRDVVKQLSDPGFWSGYDGDITPEQIGQLLGDAYAMNEYKELFTAMTTLHKVALKNNMGWDLHTENAMQRSDGTLVITDPFLAS